jgi:hypothetical protein
MIVVMLIYIPVIKVMKAPLLACSFLTFLHFSRFPFPYAYATATSPGRKILANQKSSKRKDSIGDNPCG